MQEFVPSVTKWLNDNQGVVAILLFLIGALATGLFRLLRKPRFRFKLLPGPTYACTFFVGKKFQGCDVHRTAIALYLNVTNVGSAASSICKVMVGYHWDVRLGWQSIRYHVGWFWIKHPAIIATDFQVSIGNDLKFFPFLFQRSTVSFGNTETFLESGRSTNRVVYFQQSDSWGGCFPTSKNGQTRVKVRLQDAFGRFHTRKFKIPVVSLAEARKYNPSFGATVMTADGAEKRDLREIDLSQVPYGFPIENRPNLVQSPYVTDPAYINVAGFLSGAPVRCPYTGRIFRVP